MDTSAQHRYAISSDATPARCISWNISIDLVPMPCTARLPITAFRIRTLVLSTGTAQTEHLQRLTDGPTIRTHVTSEVASLRFNGPSPSGTSALSSHAQGPQLLTPHRLQGSKHSRHCDVVRPHPSSHLLHCRGGSILHHLSGASERTPAGRRGSSGDGHNHRPSRSVFQETRLERGISSNTRWAWSRGRWSNVEDPSHTTQAPKSVRTTLLLSCCWVVRTIRQAPPGSRRGPLFVALSAFVYPSSLHVRQHAVTLLVLFFPFIFYFSFLLFSCFYLFLFSFYKFFLFFFSFFYLSFISFYYSLRFNCR